MALSTLRAQTFPGQDGRIARGLRTREAILDAYEALMVDADAPPTGAELAARAGVSARSVFTHFNDMDGVLAAVARRAFEWVIKTHVDIPVHLSLPERLDRFMVRQAQLLERTAPVSLAFRTARHGRRRGECAPAVSEILGGVDVIRRRYLDYVFGREIVAAGSEGPDVLEGLVATTSWNLWHAMRVAEELDEERARNVMRRCMWGLLSPWQGAR